MNLSKILFSFEGRINRAPYWGYAILSSLVLNGLMFGLMFIGSDILTIGAPILYIPIIWISLALVIKRLHDLDKSGWMALLMLVPLANLYIVIIVLFFKGTTGKNQFGEDPLGGTIQATASNSKSTEL